VPPYFVKFEHSQYKLNPHSVKLYFSFGCVP